MSILKLSFTGLFFFLYFASSMAQHTEPMPITGQKRLKEFIKIHLDYPEKAFLENTQGTVKIKFTTDKNGEIIDIKIIQSVSAELDSSAISLLKLVQWNPATFNGKPVTGSAKFEIKYNTKSFNKNAKRRGYLHIVPPFTAADTSGIIYSLKQVDTVPEAILKPEIKSVSDYIYSRLSYPDAASKLGLSGEVKLSFIIETNGLPSNIVAIKHLGGGCTEEAMSIIEKIKWNPGIINKKAVRVKYFISVNFKKGKNKDGHIPSQQGSGI